LIYVNWPKALHCYLLIDHGANLTKRYWHVG